MAPSAHAEDVQAKQWYLDAMQAEKMWEVSKGKGIKVAVVDTGVDPSTDALQGQVLPGKDPSGLAGGANDDYLGHGTSMAEIIAGTGKNGSIQGLAPEASIIPIRAALGGTVKSQEQRDSAPKTLWAAAKSDAKIINMSFGGAYDPESAKAVQYARKSGKLLFAGTGNDGEGRNKPQYPASYPGVVGVAATDSQGKVGAFSQYGPNVDLAAPGVDAPAWCDKSLTKYCTESGGTSMATAIASASAALIWSKHPDWTANQVLRVLIDTAGRESKAKATSKYVGYGAIRPRLNLLEGKGDPGEPGKSPVENSEPSEEASASSPAGEGDGGKSDAKGAKGGTEQGAAGSANASAEGESGNTMTYVGIGAAAVAVVAAGAFAWTRRRRS